MGIFKFNNDKVDKIFYDGIISTKERIEVESGKCRYNFRCQMNAAHEALKHKHKSLAMVVYMDNGEVDPIIHFINYNKGKYVDNTLGEWSQKHEYYLIRHISPEDFLNVNYIFTSYRKTLRNGLSWWLRLTSDIFE